MKLRLRRPARPREMVGDRDMTAAVGEAGGPASWERARAGATVALHRDAWRDARWSSIFRRDSHYADSGPADPERVAEANRRGRRDSDPAVVQGPVMKPAVWTWEVPLYFWFGGMAAGASFIAVACDVAGDGHSARIARRVTLGALAPSPALLVMDLGRPERFHHMLRIVKPRSPMSMGSWCLTVFGGLASAAVGADLLERPRAARGLGVGTAAVGTYLGSYTGVLLAATAVPLWARSRLLLGPIFVSTATLTGAAATRLTLSALGLEEGHPTRDALGHVENASIAAELVLSQLNEHRLGALASVMRTGEGGRWFERAEWLGRAGLVARVVGRRRPLAEHGASVCFMAAALCYRYGWVRAGRDSARDDAAVARTARARATREEPALSITVVEPA